MNLIVRFPPPGFFLADVRAELRLDGVRIHGGSFASGFVASAEVEPGTHTLDAVIGEGFLARKRSWTVSIPEEPADASYEMKIGYSRMWGNFEEAFQLRLLETAEDMPRVRIAAEAPRDLDLDLSAYRAENPQVYDEVDFPSYPVRATWIMLACLAVVMLLEFALPVAPREGLEPSISTLDALGGLGFSALRDGDFHRLVTCTLLHVDPVHLALNGFALVMAGMLVERKIGAFWFSVVYAASALGGSFMSLALNKGNVISVGASGAVLGLFAAGVVLVAAYPASERMGLRLQLARVLVPSLLPMLDLHGQTVDFGAHLGGAMVGLVVGFTLLGPLKKSHGGPSFERATIAKGLTALSILVVLGSISVVALRTYPAARAKASLAASLLPDGDLPDRGMPTDTQLEKWRVAFPGDPRVLIWCTRRALATDDADSFERSLRDGREAVKRTAPLFPKETVATFFADFDALEADRDLLLLMPNDVSPKDEAVWTEKLPSLAVKYPKDPRVRLELALAAYRKKDPKGALAEVAAARAAEPAVKKFFPKGLDLTVLAAIEALALRDLGRIEEAKPVAKRVCAGEEGEYPKGLLAERGMCP